MRTLKILAIFLLSPLMLYAQAFTAGGAGTVVPSAVNCATSVDGSVVGVQNPLSQTIVTQNFSGTLTSGIYYVKYTFYDFTGRETLASPESKVQLTATGGLNVQAPNSGIPQSAAGMRVYISSTSGSETMQGSTIGKQTFSQNAPLVVGAALPQANTTVCRIVANDAMWPTGTGYNVALTGPTGNTQPGFPMLWQLTGPGTTINLSNGLPYYHGVVMFPSPILASPLNHATQSIAGPLSLGQYGLSVGSLKINGVPLTPAGNSLPLNLGQIYVGNSLNVATGVTPSGDWNFSAPGISRVTALNGVSLSSLGTGLLKNNGITGQPSIGNFHDVVNLFSGGAGCTGHNALAADGTCQAGGGGGSGDFPGLVGGTNTTSAFVCGSGCSFTVAGSGTNNANQVNGGAVPPSAMLLGTNGGAQPVAVTVPPSATLLGTDSGSNFIPQVGTIPNNTTGNANTATGLAAVPSVCTGYAHGVDVGGNGQCDAPSSDSDVIFTIQASPGSVAAGKAACGVNSTGFQCLNTSLVSVLKLQSLYKTSNSYTLTGADGSTAVITDNIVTPAADTWYKVEAQVSQTNSPASCAGSASIAVRLDYTDADSSVHVTGQNNLGLTPQTSGAGSTMAAFVSLTGAVSSASTIFTGNERIIHVKASTALQAILFVTADTLSGCSPFPALSFTPLVYQVQ